MKKTSGLRRMLPVLLALTLLLAVPGSMLAETPTDAVFETGAEAALHMKAGWNLGNSMDATGDWIPKYREGTNEDYETAWNNPVTPASLFPKLKALGLSTVRIPITWRYHFDEAGNIDPAWMERVKELTDQGLAAGLYVIINIHHDTGADGWLRASEANYARSGGTFIRLWEQIAETFRDYPQELLFEGFNEMLDEKNEWNNPGTEALTVVNRYNQDFVNTVRASGGNNKQRNLICNTYAAATTGNCLKGFTLPEDSAERHLLAEVHCYTPYEFITDEGITWTKPISEYNSYVERSVDDYFGRVSAALTARGIPVVIGEFSTEDKGNTESRLKWYTRVAAGAKAIGAAAVIWDNGHTFSMGHLDRTGDADEFPELVAAVVQAYAEE